MVVPQGICNMLLLDFSVSIFEHLSTILILFCEYRTLFAQLDHCVSAFGKRLLKSWLARPLCCIGSIMDRQDAIASLKVSFKVLYAENTCLFSMKNSSQMIFAPYKFFS